MVGAKKELTKVPEHLLKKRKEYKAVKAKQAQAVLLQKAKQKKEKKKLVFKRAEQFVKEYRQREKDGMRLNRMAKMHGNDIVPEQAKLAFVIRIRDINQMCPQAKKVLKILRLQQINNGVFIKLNKATLNMMQIINPYVTWGEPNLKSVRELIYKRGHGKVEKKSVPLSDNSIIEGALGKKNMICMEDLIHEIFTVGANFKSASNFLWPFKLSAPKDGFKKSTIHFVDGGDFGNRGNKINDLILKMN